MQGLCHSPLKMTLTRRDYGTILRIFFQGFTAPPALMYGGGHGARARLAEVEPETGKGQKAAEHRVMLEAWPELQTAPESAP